MSLVVTKDQEILAGTVARWGERRGLRAAARAEVDIPPGQRPRGLPPWWPQTVDLGLPGLAVPESLGGAGAGVEELAVALAELGRQIAPGPLASSAAAGLVLAAARNLAASGDGLDVLNVLLSGVAAGTVVAAVALDGQAEAARTAAAWRVSGEAGLVIGARQANWLLVRAKTPEGPRWLAAEPTGNVTVSPVKSLDVARPMDRVSLSDALVPERQVLAGVTDDLVRDLYVTTAAPGRARRGRPHRAAVAQALRPWRLARRAARDRRGTRACRDRASRSGGGQLGRPDHHRVRLRRAARAIRPTDPARGDRLVPAVLRAGGRVGSRLAAHPGRPGGWRLVADRAEGLDVDGTRR